MTNHGRLSEPEIAIYIGLGSNIGDRESNLRAAIARIEGLGLEVVRESSIYETEPVGFTDQPWFLNQVIEAKMRGRLESQSEMASGDPETVATIQAEALLSQLLKIERDIGRERTVTNGPRVIDIDVLLFDDMIIGHSNADQECPRSDRNDLFVPHLRMHLRRFVLEPLCEIAPEFLHPVLKKTCRALLAELEDSSVVRLYK